MTSKQPYQDLISISRMWLSKGSLLIKFWRHTKKSRWKWSWTIPVRKPDRTMHKMARREAGRPTGLRAGPAGRNDPSVRTDNPEFYNHLRIHVRHTKNSRWKWRWTIAVRKTDRTMHKMARREAGRPTGLRAGPAGRNDPSVRKDNPEFYNYLRIHE